ncbi:helix-turn-helix domain-containing protein [Mycolicibacterium canariasense]|uniref:helix-turn-helix domain-containing protein n=1 Tax=Mycolicibacterium canariasense TaxID=228230 RepID=UPI0032D56EF7
MEEEQVREDWPFGPALRRHREEAGLSQREASRRTATVTGGKPVVSAGRWKQLETGWQKNKGLLIPIGTTPATVCAAAKAVGWDRDEALQTAGFDVDTESQPAPTDWESFYGAPLSPAALSIEGHRHVAQHTWEAARNLTEVVLEDPTPRPQLLVATRLAIHVINSMIVQRLLESPYVVELGPELQNLYADLIHQTEKLTGAESHEVPATQAAESPASPEGNKNEEVLVVADQVDDGASIDADVGTKADDPGVDGTKDGEEGHDLPGA